MAFNKEKVMDAARKFVDKGQIDKAVKEYLRIVSEDPKDVRVWLKIGDLYAKKGSKQDAIETYLKVARFYHDQGFFLKAVAVYKQVLKLDPRLVDVILKLAELYRQLGLMSDAMQHFESVAAHFHREGNTKEALATVRKLVDLDPENIATRIKLAELYSKEGLVDDAATEFTVACEQLRRQGRQDDFVKVAERLLWHKPDNMSLNRELAGLYLRRNDPRRALQKLQACFKADPRDVETLGLLAQAFQALDQKAKTVSVLKELARIHTENKQRDKALEVFRKILEFVPSDPDAKEALGLNKVAPAVNPPKAVNAPPIPEARVPDPRRQTTGGSGPAAVPPPRVSTTPLPIGVRNGDAKFNITTDLPPIPQASQRMTGSMPLVDESSLSGVDFALPEYDGDDFSADMEPAPDPRQMSAAGEQHAEEISKILAETDVYVKYGLHQKAVDHLRRIFGLDPENVEAHERLKDIFLSQGREQEAETELLKLAELVASADPDRAEQYLQELLALNGTHTGAFDLARRFRLRVARLSSSHSTEAQYNSSGVVPIDVDVDDQDLGHLELAAPPRMAVGVARGAVRERQYEEPAYPSGRVAHGSPPAGRAMPAPPTVRGFDASQLSTDNFSLDFEPSPSQSTRQMAPEQVEALNSLDDDGLIVDHPPGRWPEGDIATRFDPALAQNIDAQLDDEELGDDIDSEVAAELAMQAQQEQDGEDLPFDPDEARRFDAAVQAPARTNQQYGAGYEDSTGPNTRPAAYADADDALSVPGSYDPYGTGQSITDATAANVIDPHMADDSRAIEDELDEADFYIGQHMYAEAVDVLRNLASRYPTHRLVALKLREVEAYASGSDPHQHADDLPAARDGSTGTDAISLEEIEEVGHDDLDDSRRSSERAIPRSPSVMLEHAVDEGDAATHFDLGLAYKEMGLFEEAVKAFEKALTAPGREVSCRVMIGMCYREANNPTEAVHQFKQALHVISPPASDREMQSIYYEIGVTYEAVDDVAEALYYFEMVAKRDPSFADAGARADALRERGVSNVHDSMDDDL